MIVMLIIMSEVSSINWKIEIHTLCVTRVENGYSRSETSESFDRISNKAELILSSFFKYKVDSGIVFDRGEEDKFDESTEGDDVDNWNSAGSNFSMSERLYTVAWSGVRLNFDVCNGVGAVVGDFTVVSVELDKYLGVYLGDVVEFKPDNGNSSVVEDVDGVETKVLDDENGVEGEVWVELGKRDVVDFEYDFCIEIEIDKGKDSFIGLGAEVVGVVFFGCSDVKNKVDVETDLGKGRGEDVSELYSISGNKYIESGLIPNTVLDEIECTPALLI